MVAVALLVSSVTEAHYREQLEGQVQLLHSQLQETRAEMADIKHQQEFINMVSADMDQRLAEVQGWRK